MVVKKQGLDSQDLYLHGYFSASIKLHADYIAGVVVAFYFGCLARRWDCVVFKWDWMVDGEGESVVDGDEIGWG
ncbi:hypothetical protein V6N13_001164 [Hibiscus sabdariffa]|uniref:Transmembrane protein n=1 Tax=Hibiscus sabdariffa TaxID=183260 RepID=A0ABR1ZCJ6_9ROSI